MIQTMTIKVDTASRGYKYMSRSEQAAARNTEWLGTVQADGEIGALGQTNGRYFLYSSGRKPIELAAPDVLAALTQPGHINPRGRKPGANGPHRPHSVTMDSQTKESAQTLGEGNLSRGIRLAVEYVTTQVHPSQFKLWRDKQGSDN